MNAHNRLSIFGIALALTSSAVFAITPSLPSTMNGNNAVSPQTTPVARSGVIDYIDFSGKSIVIDKVNYLFIPTLTKVFSKDPAINDNPQKLKSRQAVNFTTMTTSDGRQRITDITVK